MTAASDPHLLTGAYALNALGDDERGAFEEHLGGCETCPQEVAGFAAALARLASRHALPSPPALRARVLARVEHERQLPPPRRVTAHPAPASRARAGGRRPRWPRLALAASLAAATTLGVFAVRQHEQARQAQATAERLRSRQAAFDGLLTAPDARLSTAGPADGGPGTGTVLWSASRDQAGFLAAGLPDPGPDRVYELWLDHAGALSPAGLLTAGDGALLLTARLDGAHAVGVTLEPAGGSAQPTGKAVMALKLAPNRVL
ncbi:anti-sigma factor domain-containing protein [Kitasatospora sp. NPDC056783]|uniref:anti-sigma factor n=1 Tax=Kitasatospora sp. NPDC056783 TaxID=3345943 RepID=UPI0036AA6579